MGPKSKKKEAEKPETAANEGQTNEAPLPTDKEVKLKQQLEDVTEELRKIKLEVEELRQENDFLQQETQQTRVETHEYMQYMSKKTKKRQDAVITLSDRNAEQIKDIRQKKEEMVQNFDKQKGELNETILARESELASIKQDLDNLSEYKDRQHEQQTEINELEKKVAEMRLKHSEAVQKLKAQFLNEKKQFQQQSDNNLMELSQEAKKEAHFCLKNHSQQIKQENRALRKDLLELIHRSRAMHAHKLQLEEQRKVLMREHEYAGHLQLLRGKRLKDMYDSFGLDSSREQLDTDRSRQLDTDRSTIPQM